MLSRLLLISKKKNLWSTMFITLEKNNILIQTLLSPINNRAKKMLSTYWNSCQKNPFFPRLFWQTVFCLNNDIQLSQESRRRRSSSYKPCLSEELLRRNLFDISKQLFQEASTSNTKSCGQLVHSLSQRIHLQVMNISDPYQLWKEEQSAALGCMVQKELKELQKASKGIFCQLKRCGFGCTVHAVVYCLMKGPTKPSRTLLGA